MQRDDGSDDRCFGFAYVQNYIYIYMHTDFVA